MKEALKVQDYVIHEFDSALMNQNIKVYYQPVIRSISGEICGMEALARWDSPVYGLLPPKDFIAPLEDSGQIYKLDIYVIHEVCRTIRERSISGKAAVPVSFNLSRLDFISCDIFTEVEAAIRDYEIPRDMLRIEITESIMAQDSARIDAVVKKFQRAGYQVWIDDFGSGYSSLNLLKDYVYDEIKIDMEFLSNFTERSRQVIISIVDMAKRIGIRTLAEGVETEEQFDFLKEIGCEKVQGYYFGKPAPLEESMMCCAQRGIGIEERMWNNYYDGIGKVNFITDRAMAIVQYDRREIQFLHVNSYFQEVLKRAGVTDMERMYRNVNSPSMPLYHQFRTIHKNILEDGMVQEMDYTIRGEYLRVKAKRIVHYGERYIYQLEVQNLSQRKLTESLQQTDSSFRMMSLMYDAIYRMDMNQDKVEPLTRNIFYGQKNLRGIGEYSAEEAMRLIMRESIYSADQKHFREWSNPATIEQRLREEGKICLAEYFRTREENGSYVWKVHRMLLLPGQQHPQLLYSVMRTPLDNERTLRNIAFSHGISSGEENQSANMWKGLLDSHTAYIFWKDRERRFLGTNQSFLDFYGIEDESEILGKTDEEMNWHVDNEPFLSDEKRVIQNGETLLNRVGKCIVRGALHTILATKMPIYRNGEIVGLLGYFIDIDEFAREGEGIEWVLRRDALTGLMNATGMTLALPDYVEQLENYGKKFALLRITVPQYRATIESYGRKTANRLAKRIAQMLVQEVGMEACCARIHSASFTICLQYAERREVELLGRRIVQQLSDIHSISGFNVTINPEKKIVYADDFPNYQDLILLIHETEQRA